MNTGWLIQNCAPRLVMSHGITTEECALGSAIFPLRTEGQEMEEPRNKKKI